jgi:integrase
MTSRRGAGEGSVFYEASAGRWCATIDLGYVNGKRKRVTRRARTKREAMAKLQELQVLQAAGEVIPDQRTTTEKYLHWWLAEVLPMRRDRVRESTARQYQWMLLTHVIPRLGRVRLAELKPAHVQRMVSDMERNGLSVSTSRQALSVLSGALKHAVRNEMIQRNPVSLVDWPSKARSNAARGTDPETVRRLFAEADKTRVGPLFRLAFTTGMRRGEILALRWEDVDLTAETIAVRGTLKRRPRSAGGPAWYIDAPKSAMSYRVVPLIPSLTRGLRAWRAALNAERLRAGAAWHDNDLVFPTTVGTPMDPDNLSKMNKELCRRAGLPTMRFHDSRHTAATLLINEGVPLEVIQQLLGHSSAQVTNQIYAKIKEGPLRQAANVMERVLGGT